VAVVVEQESHGWEDQLEDQTGEPSVVEVEAMIVSGCAKHSHCLVAAMMPVVEGEEEHSGAVDAVKTLEEGSGHTQMKQQTLFLVQQIDG
jgi:hypothetical protein